ncbi:MAG: glycoside hydrolase family 127 protein [Kiritimatiellae bacterium]|nr:glycoside hydrolase family 127 protein [Kiritimatiellia bacterium]
MNLLLAGALIAAAGFSPAAAPELKVRCADWKGWKLERTSFSPDALVEEHEFRFTSPSPAPPPQFTVSFETPLPGARHLWRPDGEGGGIPPNWGGRFETSLARMTPVWAFVDDADANRLLVAADEAKRTVAVTAGLKEEGCVAENSLTFFTEPEAGMTDYRVRIRVDRRGVFFGDAVGEAVKWIERRSGFKPVKPPPAAFEPLYSSWYSFHQDVFAADVEKECEIASKLGMKTLIVDDGWQTEDTSRGYRTCGDWKLSRRRFPDMAAHVRRVHDLGMKYMLWYSVPFVGDKSGNYARFKGRYLNDGATAVLDPRFPEVRRFLADTYLKALREWDIDGFKLDFIDSFRCEGEDPAVKENYAGRDVKSVSEAVDLLMKTVYAELSAVKPGILVEFRQRYIGPAIRQYGNMLRAGDCPGDAVANRVRTANLRLTSGGSAVHSDMLEWNRGETPEEAAKFVLSAIFSVVQYSVMLRDYPESHRRMIGHWIRFAREHRDALLFGRFRPRRCGAKYPLIEAEGDSERVVGVYEPCTAAEVDAGDRDVYVLNSTGGGSVIIDAAAACDGEVYDTFGTLRGKVKLAAGLNRVATPVSGYVKAVRAGSPAVKPAMTAAKPGAVKPRGWLRDRAIAARDGFTGHMDEVDEHFRLAWTTNCMRRGKNLNWGNRHLGSWSSEGGAYWFDGLVKLAWQLDDAGLKAMAKRRLEPLLNGVDGNSVGFLWWLDRRDPAQEREAFTDGSWQFWVIGMAERAVSAYYEATGDARARRAIAAAFDYEAMARRHGGGATFASGVFDACRLTGSPGVAKCLDISCSLVTNCQYATPPSPLLVDTLNLKRTHHALLRMPTRHGVYASEQLLSLLAAYMRTGDRNIAESVKAWYGFFDRHCAQPYGVTMMDEEWGWAGVHRGTETCDVAAESFTRMRMLACFGEGRWGDDAELAFFNAGPGCVSRDVKRHVYMQMPNRLAAAHEGSLFSCGGHFWTLYSNQHWPLCCTAALNRILPNFVWSMWLKTADGGVAAALYGPSEFTAELPAGEVAFEEKTDYPFDEKIEITVKKAPGAEFALQLRMPGWCETPEVAVNGVKTAAAAGNGFLPLRRAWKAGDRVDVRLPMKPRVRRWRDMNDYGRERVSVYLGPLLFAYPVPELNDDTPAAAPREPALRAPFDPAAVKVVRKPLRRPWNWSVADAPVRLVAGDSKGAAVELVPYGCTKLRISAFTEEKEK